MRKIFSIIICIFFYLSVLAIGAPALSQDQTPTNKEAIYLCKKKVHVKGYYRKDGTYVKPHTRNSPGSGSSSKSPSYKSKSSSSKKTKRSSSARSQFLKQTGYPKGRPGYIVDHIVPLACGGADSPSNMQWQTKAAAKAKDKWERKG